MHRAEAAVDRLAAEFAELCHRGPVRLPDSSGLDPVKALLAQARAEWKESQPQCHRTPRGGRAAALETGRR